jgi:hypothetical protein
MSREHKKHLRSFISRFSMLAIMHTSPFCTLLCTLGIFIVPISSVFLCSSNDESSRSHGLVLIDGEFEDCSFEGPLPGIYDHSPIAKMTFDFSEPRGKLSEMWLNFLVSPRADPDRFNRDSVREITLKGNDWFGMLPLVEHAFSKMHGIEKIHWEIRQPVTDSILRSLEENNPGSKLYYSFHSWSGEPSFILANSTLLYSLKADIGYAWNANYAPLDFIFSALSDAPNIRELDIFLHADGCEKDVGNPFAFPFINHPSVRFPPLEVLRLDGYDLDERSDGGMAWAWREKREEWDAKWQEYLDNDDDEAEPPSFPERPEDDGRTNLETWMEAMDWSKLHTLHLAYPSKPVLDRLQGPALPSLKHLSLKAATGWGARQEEILSFVVNGTSNLLHSISLQKMGAESGNELLKTLTASPNLTHELRQFSYGAGGVNIFFLNQKILSVLLTQSPDIEHLDINVPRKFNMSTEGQGLLNDILSTSTLKHLTLRFPLPDQGIVWEIDTYSEMRQKYLKEKDQGDEPDPLINHATVTKLFEDMRVGKKGVELEELEFYVGDWDHRFERGLLGNPMLRVAYWKCTIRYGCQGEQTRVVE